MVQSGVVLKWIRIISLVLQKKIYSDLKSTVLGERSGIFGEVDATFDERLLVASSYSTPQPDL